MPGKITNGLIALIVPGISFWDLLFLNVEIKAFF
jgi:hypothetical protein